jgi:hypothetical protein
MGRRKESGGQQGSGEMRNERIVPIDESLPAT